MGVSTINKIVSRKYLPLILAILLTLVSAAHAQVQDWKSVSVSVQAKDKTLRSVLENLESQTGTEFSFDQSELDLEQKITFSFDGSLYEAFRALGNMAGLDFRQTSSNITIRKRKTTLNLAEARFISGTVYDKTNNTPLPGVTVLVKGTNKATNTNLQGEFSFRLVKENIPETVLVFRYLGMHPKEITLNGQSNFKVLLEQDAMSLKEVVVTSAYTGEKRREEVVGSISQLTARELQVDRPVESFDKMLQGMVAGVQVETTTEPNKPVKINIRGQGSLSSFGGSRSTSTQPLFVVDGVPMYEQQQGDGSGSFNNETLLNPLSNINPQDIESVSVLKDASASAIYGADAANGVIIITTKKGAAGKTRFNIDYRTGVSSFINQFKYLSGPQYYEVLRETLLNSGFNAYTAEMRAGSKTTDTNWFDMLNRNASYHSANFDVSGGKDNTTYRISTGYLNQQSSAVGNDLEKMFFRLRLDQSINEKLKVGVNLSPSLTRQNTLNNFGNVQLPPNISPYKEDGRYNDFLKVPNPLAVLAQNEEYSEGLAFTGSANAKYNLTENISFYGLMGSDYYSKKETQYESGKNATGVTQGGELRIYDRSNLGWIAFVQGMYDRTFTGRHTINFLAGTQAQDEETQLLYGRGAGFTYDRMRDLSMAQTRNAASSKNAKATVSYYSQLGYDLDKKYFLNLNVRSDQSSVFGGDKQVAVNGSIGLGWIVTKEKFLQPNGILNHLRLRTSYGSTGNSRIGSYAARGLYDFSTKNPYNGNSSSIPYITGAPNPDLGWEKNYKFNLGFDVTLLSRINVTAEVYHNTIRDLISSISVPLETGFETVSANTGTMVNKGLELTINSANIETPDFTWSTAFNFGMNRNKITAYNAGLMSNYSEEDAAVAKVGLSTGSIWGFRWAGVDPATGEELYYDNEDNLINSWAVSTLPIAAGTVLGDRLPRFEGGLINSFTYKGLSLTVNLVYSYGASMMASASVEANGRNLDHSNQSVNLLDRWQQPGDITTIPKLHDRNTATALLIRRSSRFVHDLTHIKLSNVSLSYQLPEKLTEAVRLRQVSLYTNAANLLYWYREKSPEGRNGVAELRFLYPEMRTVVGGIKIGF